MIDWARIDELKAEIGGDGFAEIVQIFLEEVDQAVDDLNGEMSTEDARAALHFLKGGALNLGFAEFSKLCQMGELKASKGDMPDLTEILASYQASRAAFLTGIKTTEPP